MNCVDKGIPARRDQIGKLRSKKTGFGQEEIIQMTGRKNFR
jgi:hypothetical protein